MQLSPTFCQCLLDPNILFSTLFSNILSLCSSFNVRDKVSHLYRTTGKIMFLYILIFTIFYKYCRIMVHCIDLVFVKQTIKYTKRRISLLRF
jgi:hypothetical protein